VGPRNGLEASKKRKISCPSWRNFIVRTENIFIYSSVYFSFIKPRYAHPVYITIKFCVYSYTFWWNCTIFREI
jgi:hypothetical protein